jgi:hypothetical protein
MAEILLTGYNSGHNREFVVRRFVFLHASTWNIAAASIRDCFLIAEPLAGFTSKLPITMSGMWDSTPPARAIQLALRRFGAA